MLRLESCLRGEAAETIEGLGYSEFAYNAAIARLQRKYGGNRRKVQAQLDELRKIKPLIEGNPKSLDKFADVLERTVVVLKENKLEADLAGGTLYGIVVEKIPENLLKQYCRLETLNEWLAEEADFQMQASEVKHGFTQKSGEFSQGRHDDGNGNRRGTDWKSGKSYGTQLDDDQQQKSSPLDNDRKQKPFRPNGERKQRACQACGESHPILKCQVFTGWPTQKKWEAAKQFGLCYRCLRDDHLGNECPESKLCNIDGCLKTHHPLLHEKLNQKKEPTPPITEEDRTTHTTTLNTVKKHEERIIALSQ